MSKSEDFPEIYCCVCERMTTHRVNDDDVFEHGLECMNCQTVWEAEPESDEKDDNAS